jgi:hypothetical protein
MYGNLVCVKKSKKYCGKSQITNKALYRVLYVVYFCKEDEKTLGFIDGKTFTFDKSFNKKSNMIKFLKQGGYNTNEYIFI